MKKRSPAIYCLLMLAASVSTASAQQSSATASDNDKPVPAIPGLPATPVLPNQGHTQFLSMLNQSMKKPQATTSSEAEVHPMFQFSGPDMRSAFWADPETAGRILVLQGELMVKMGETLMKQGQAMLEKKDPAGAATK